MPLQGNNMLDSAIDRADTGAVKSPSYVRELSRVLHRCDDGERLIAMFQAFGDESYLHSVDATPYYVVAGYLGTAGCWERFEGYWRRSMRELGISDIGLHASDCEAGHGPYKGMSEAKRRNLEYRLIVDISASDLFGFVAATDVPGYRKYADKFDAFLTPRWKKLNKPYVLTVRNWVHSLCIASMSFKSRDPIAFVLDRNKEFWKRAEEWYHLDINNEDIEWRDRLGSFAQDNRLNAIGLQAADLLAFSAMRQLSNRPPWHWPELTQATKIIQTVTNEAFWSEHADSLDAFSRSVGA
jgi:hypothetical protein